MDPSADRLYASIRKNENAALPWLLTNLAVVLGAATGWATGAVLDQWAFAVTMVIVGFLCFVGWLPFSAAMAAAVGRLRHVRAKAAIEGREVSDLELCLQSRRAYQRWLGSLLLVATLPNVSMGMALLADADTAYAGFVAFALAGISLVGGIWGHVAGGRTAELADAARSNPA